MGKSATPAAATIPNRIARPDRLIAPIGNADPYTSRVEAICGIIDQCGCVLEPEPRVACETEVLYREEMSTWPILYSFRRCPYAIRARLALLASQTVCIIREVKLSAKPVEMLAASPKGTVPVLILPNGSVIEQSIEIMRWALMRQDPGAWLDHDDGLLIDANDGPFKHHLDRAKYSDRYGSDAVAHRAACLDLLRPLEDRLGVTPFLCGESMRLPDAAIVPFVRQFASIDRAWFDTQPLPHVRRWLDGIVASSLFDGAMLRLPPWQAGDVEIRFPHGTS